MNTSRTLTLFLALALLGFALLILSTPTAHAADPVIVRVKVGGATSGSCGGAWDTACDLQYALTSTVGTAELWVAAGTYKPTTGADRAISFQLRDGIALYGGFAGGETQRSQRSFTTNLTILSGDIGAAGVASDNAYHVVTGSAVTNTAVLDGFTVTEGYGNGFNPNDRGGGMYNYNSGPTVANVSFISNTAIYYGSGMFNWKSNPTLTNVAFISNTGTSTGTSAGTNNGGGMYNYSSSPILTNVTFSSNSASWGGGMANNGSSPILTNVIFSNNTAANTGGGMENVTTSSPTLTNVTFTGNTATNSGGGMENSGSSPSLTNVTFSNNTAGDGGGMHNYSSSPMLTNVTFAGNFAGDGGGMYTQYSSPTLKNVTFSGNSSVKGGALYLNFYSNPTLSNVTLVNNTASVAGGGMYNYDYSNPTVRNAIFWGNTAPNSSQIYNYDSTPSLYDSVVQSGYPAGTHIIPDDPRLGTLGNYGGSTQTIPLLPGSSAIDAGSDATCTANDQRGNPRVGTCDIGAYESRGFDLAKGDPSGDNQSTMVIHPFAHPLRVTVVSPDGDPVEGGVVTFTAPSSGASTTPITNIATITSGVASQGLTANGIVGSYAVTVDTAGATLSATFDLTNIKTDTTTMIGSSENPVLPGHPVTLTATVTGASPGGSITFQDGGAILDGCDAVALTGGIAPCAVSSLALGTHYINADYSGDANNMASSGALIQTVSKANTTTTLSSSANPSVRGQSVTFTAAVSGAFPGGSVTFQDGGATLSGCSAVTVSGGRAACTIFSPALGTHVITTDYSGDANNNASMGTLIQVVNRASTTIVLTSSANPVLVSRPVTFTVKVDAVAPASLTPTGTVELSETGSPGTVVLGTRRAVVSQPLIGGVATFALPPLTAGAHTFRATYNGDANCSESTSAVYTQTVDSLEYYLPLMLR